MATQLLAIKEKEIPQHEGNHGFSFETNAENILLLQATFSNCPTIIPLLFITPANQKVISPLLKSLILSTITNDIRISLEAADKFCSGELSDLTFVVWPLPVIVNNQHLMLIRIKRFDVRKSASTEKQAVEKALVCILSMTALNFIFVKDTEKTYAFELINRASSNLREITSLTQAQIVSLNHFEDEDWAELIEEFGLGELNCAIPISELPSRLETLLRSESINQFVQPRLAAMRSLNYSNFISLLVKVFEMCVKAAKADFGYDEFKRLNLRVNDPQYATHVEVLGNIIEQQTRMKDAKAIQFLEESVNNYLKKPTDQSVESFTYQFSLNPNLIPTLIQSYDFSKETVVILIIGDQGKGKSTLLNNIIRECIGSSSKQDCFKVGNTETDTTVGGEILSHPLFLPSGHQLMLVDIEGMTSFRKKDTRKSIIRENLVSSLFTIASVPCIIFDNDEVKRLVIEEYISKLCFCAKNFSTVLERIIMFLHDKEDNPSAETNIEIRNWIENLNMKYFDGREVIKVMKKPNLRPPQNRDICSQFLKKLIANIDFPKKDCFMANLNLRNMIAKLELIAMHSTTNLEKIAVTGNDLLIINRCLEEKSTNLKSIYRGIKSDGLVTLVDIYNNETRYFSVHLDESLPQKKHVQLQLENLVSRYRGKLRVVDAIYQRVNPLQQEELIDFLKQQAKFFVQQSSDLATFERQFLQFLSQLRKAVRRYPGINPIVIPFSKMNTLASELTEEMQRKEYLTVLLMPAEDLATVILHGSFIYSFGSVILLLLAPELAIPLFFGSFLTTIASGVTCSVTQTFLPPITSIPEQSKWFYNYESSRIIWNESVLEEYCSASDSTVMLVLGREKELPSLLNSLLLELCPLRAEVGYTFLSNWSSKIYQFESLLFNKRVTVIFIPTTLGRLTIPSLFVYRASVTFIFEYSRDEDIFALLNQEAEVRVSQLAVFCRQDTELRRRIEDVIFEKHIQFRVVHDKIEESGDHRTIKDHMIECIGASACMRGSEFFSMIAEAKKR